MVLEAEPFGQETLGEGIPGLRASGRGGVEQLRRGPGKPERSRDGTICLSHRCKLRHTAERPYWIAGSTSNWWSAARNVTVK